jgi:leader peptidase (prepilin peptidase)/N-methyltransferase
VNTFALLPRAMQLMVATGFGLMIGSFLNVLIHRLPRNESPWSGRSHCPHCRRTVRWFENVPVVSWLLLRARCAGCKQPIAWRYPLVEGLSGFLALVCVLRFGATAAAAGDFAFLATLLAIAWIDWEHMIIPDELSLGLTAVGLLLAATVLPIGVWRALLGAVAGAGFIWGVAWTYKRMRGVDGMGFGDVKLAAMIGAFLGPLYVLVTIFVAAFLGSLWGAVLLARGGTRKTMVAFGTFLATGAALCLFFGDAVCTWYMGLLRH